MLLCCSKGLFMRNISSKIKSGHPRASDYATVSAREVFSPAWGAVGCFQGPGWGGGGQSSNSPTLSIISHFLWQQSAWQFKSAYAQYCSSILLVEVGASVHHPVFICCLKSGSTPLSWGVFPLKYSWCHTVTFHPVVLHNSSGVIKPVCISVQCAQIECSRYYSALNGRKCSTLQESPDSVFWSTDRGAVIWMISDFELIKICGGYFIRISNFIMTFQAKGSF